MRHRFPVYPVRGMRLPCSRAIVLRLLLILFCFTATPVPLHAAGQTTLLTVEGPIGPAISDYLTRGIARAEELQADAVIIQLDTPGGLDHSMRQINQAILASTVPVVAYVAPDGARAASAGTFILYASHIAAMSTATNLGAASPVRIGGVPDKPDTTSSGQGKNEAKDQRSTTLERKMFNDASAYIKALAERHGRNGDWAVQAVRDAVSISAEEALELGVIDIIATDYADLLSQADGRQVQLASGEHTMSTVGAAVIPIEQSWRTRLLAVISDPNIAYILLLVGIYGLIYELANPGIFLPGVTGGIALLLALYAFQVLPVNYSGLALVVLGVALLVSELFIPSFGSLGIGGIIAFSVGSIILMKNEEFRISRPIIAGAIAVSSILLIWLAGRLMLLRKQKTETGMDAMIGMTGEATADFESEGWIWVLGEAWRASSADPVEKGEKVRITGHDGLFLTIEKDQEVA